jgi:hypothetical protein
VDPPPHIVHVGGDVSLVVIPTGFVGSMGVVGGLCRWVNQAKATASYLLPVLLLLLLLVQNTCLTYALLHSTHPDQTPVKVSASR